VADEREQLKVGRRLVDITRPAKLLFPDDGISKRELVAYYVAVAPRLLPYLEDRPLTLERYPDGIRGHRIIQKSASDYYPDWILTAAMKKHGGTVAHPIANDAATLAYLANQASITPHIWLSRSDRPTQPDQMVFDFDPSTGDFEPVRRAALDLAGMLRGMDVTPFLKTSGSKGLHVVVPLKRSADFGEVHQAAHALAVKLVQANPAERTLEFHKAKRGSRVFIDVNRNAYAQTYAAPYAVRARPGAPVSWPAEWKALEDGKLTPDGVTMRQAIGLLEQRQDPWAGFRRGAVSLTRMRPA